MTARTRTRTGSTDVDLSVVIPTFNRRARLQRVLAALAEQVGVRQAWEVVVVSDGSTDGTDEWLGSGRTPVPVVHVRQPNRGPAAARNHGVASARGALVLFLDDDVVPLPTMVAEHLAVHEREGEGAVVLGPMLTPDDHVMSPWVAYEQAMLHRQYRAMQDGEWAPTARQFFTGNASLARRHVVDAGGFDEGFTRAEDVELAYRLDRVGLRFVFAPAAAGLHYAERSYSSWRDTAYAYGRNDALFAVDRGQDWLLPTVARELRQHHPLVRVLARSALQRAWVGRAAGHGLDGAVRLLEAAGAGLPRPLLSAVFNLRYYQGLADELRRRRPAADLLAVGG